MQENTEKISYGAMNDEELAEMCKHGDDKAYQELMRRHTSAIYRFAKRYARTEEDTEDIVQDAFFKAWKNIKKFKRGKQFKPWIYTIAKNTALDYLKKQKINIFSEFDDEDRETSFADTLEDGGDLPDQIFENREKSEEAKTLLEKLHPEYQSVMLLRYYEDMTFEEIAVVMKKPMNTVKSWHRRALLKLREFITHRKA